MGLYEELPDDIQDVDVIIAGGGTTGCVVAARLADAAPDLSILLIEGGSNNNIPTIIHPALVLANLAPNSTASIFYKAIKESQLGDRELIVPSGGILGGGSSINLMMYSRAQRSDFDSWDAPGWSAEEMLPYLKKLETYHSPGAKERHGYDGPIHVSKGPFRASRSENDFIAAANKLGWPEIEDLQDMDSNNGIHRASRYVSPTGQRQDAASRYLHPRLQDGRHPNLLVLVHSQIVRILLEGKRAVGVELKPNPNTSTGTSSIPRLRTVKARKMVIASCGACGTPPLLERSGIGRPELLERAGVPLAVDLPGVGHEYEDHNLLVYPYRSNLSTGETLDAVISGRSDATELIKNGDKILGWNAMDVTGKLRPTEADAAALGPEFQEAWNRDFREKPNRPLVIMSLVNTFPADPTAVPVGQYFSVSVFSVYPYSRGHVHITGPDLSDPLDLKTGFFSDIHDIDIKTHMWGYKQQREIARRMETYRGEVAFCHPPFPAGSKAACIEVDGPLTQVENIAYTAEDDFILEKWLRENVNTTWHSLGTCKMLPFQKMGVVDTDLNVYGVEGLKIADLSIVPRNVAANTNNTALAIGEKAADIFIQELLLGRN
ncbi:putative glucose dehydrogenase [Xylogone sp. PMI_703]|nr:putative glucose dehydrogenase [Xylogone sp. PMI_703]